MASNIEQQYTNRKLSITVPSLIIVAMLASVVMAYFYYFRASWAPLPKNEYLSIINPPPAQQQDSATVEPITATLAAPVASATVSSTVNTVLPGAATAGIAASRVKASAKSTKSTPKPKSKVTTKAKPAANKTTTKPTTKSATSKAPVKQTTSGTHASQ